ncbi:MAG TPA: hypothetical protein VKY25_02555 [Erysipelothrix sp.]|nr:hypothetical protein [Erysipelothrix sp.]
MKKTMLCLLIVLMSGCSLGRQESDDNVINDSIWGYDFNEDEYFGAFSSMKSMTISNSGIYYKMSVSDGEGLDHETGSLIGYLPHGSDQATIVNANVSTSCSSNNPKGCTSYFKTGFRNLKFYNNKLYVTIEEFDDNSFTKSMVLVEMDLDGNNRKTVAVLAEKVPSSYNFTMLYHRGKIYYSFGESAQILYQLDMQNWEISEITFDYPISNLELVSADDQTITLYASTYDLYPNPILYLDIETNEIVVDDINLPLFTHQKDSYLYFDYDHNAMHLYSKKTNQSTKLQDHTGTAIVKGDAIIIFSLPGGSTDLNIHSVTLYDLEGNLLDYYDTDKGFIYGFVQLLYKDSVFGYRYVEDEVELIRFKITDRKLGDLHVIDSWKG